MTDDIRPDYKLLANSTDITALIRERFISLHFTDEAGLQSDALEIVLADNDPDKPIAMPPTGAELELFLGYDGAFTRMGLFVADEIELSGWPGEMTIRAHAAPFDQSKGGKNTLQSQKTRSWAKDTKLGDLVKKIAKEHGLEPAVSASLAAIPLPHMDQSDESDLHFLVRVARKYDAVVKPASGKLVMAKRGETKSVGGQQLPAITLKPTDVQGWRVTQAKRENSGMVVAYYHQTKKAKRTEVKVGAGEPVTRLRMAYPSQAMAKAAAQAELDKRNRGEVTLSLELVGRIDLMAEGPLTTAGFRDGVNGNWIITRVEHELSKSGYTCTVEAETPNSSKTANVEEVTE